MSEAEERRPEGGMGVETNIKTMFYDECSRNAKKIMVIELFTSRAIKISSFVAHVAKKGSVNKTVKLYLHNFK